MARAIGAMPAGIQARLQVSTAAANDVAADLDAEVAFDPPGAPTPDAPGPVSDAASGRSRVCFVGLESLPVMSRAHNHHGIGGEQVQHSLLARALAARGHAVTMVVADYGQPEREVINGVVLHRAHGLDEGIPVLRFLHPRMTKLWAALQRADADVYYCSCAGHQLGLVVRFAQRHGRRVVFRIAHDTDCVPGAQLIRFWRDRKIYEWGLRRADVVLAQSAQQSRVLRTHYGLGSEQAAMLVDPATQMLPFAQRDVDVLWVNNLRPFKRPQLALDLARRLPQLQVHVIGGSQAGHEDLYAAIEAEAATIPNLHFHGRVPYHDVNAFYERARVFINTSESEGFPNSYLQAWRRGTPTVAYFDPDGLIATQGLGVAVRSDDPGAEQMASQVARVASSETDWAPLSAACLRFMDARYGDDRVLEPYLQAFGLAPWPALHPIPSLPALEDAP